MANSPLVGRRPRMSLMRWYSSLFNPSAAYGCSFSGVAIACETESRGALITSILSSGCSVAARSQDDDDQASRDRQQRQDGQRDSGWTAEIHRPAQAEAPGNHEGGVIAVDVEQAALPVLVIVDRIGAWAARVAHVGGLQLS